MKPKTAKNPKRLRAMTYHKQREYFFMDRILGACLSRCLPTFPNKELLRVTYE